jgi:hypothetical protein
MTTQNGSGTSAKFFDAHQRATIGAAMGDIPGTTLVDWPISYADLEESSTTASRPTRKPSTVL